MKKIMTLIMVAAMMLGLVACGGGSSEGGAGSEGRTTITMAYWNPKETMQPLIDLIEEKLPVKIQYTYQSSASYFTTMRMKLLAGNAEDIIAFSPGEELNYGEQGLLVDVSEICGDNFTQSSKYYVPMNTWYEGIFYNKDIFKKHNIEVPTTFDEFLAVCEKLDKAGVVPFTIGGKSPDSLTKCLLGYVNAEFLLQEEGQGFDVRFGKGEASMADEWVKYVEKWAQLIEKGYINKDHLGITAQHASDEFITGFAAMTPSGTWAYETIKQRNFNMNFGIIPYLGDTPENACLVGGAGGGYCLNAKSKNQKLAWQVLEVIASPEGQRAMVAGSPGSGSLHKDVGYETLPEEFAGVETVLSNNRVYCAWHYWGEGSVLGQLGAEMQEVILGRKTVLEGLQHSDKLAKQWIADAQG